MVSTIERLHCIQDSQLGPNGVLYREVLPYSVCTLGVYWVTVCMDVRNDKTRHVPATK